jgi:hypothetical protein
MKVEVDDGRSKFEGAASERRGVLGDVARQRPDFLSGHLTSSSRCGRVACQKGVSGVASLVGM